jgi:hypothetical protein
MNIRKINRYSKELKMSDHLSIIDTVNRDVLKSFKNLNREKSHLYTSAKDEYLTCMDDKSMIVYDNPNEIDFEGTFRLTRSKLIPVAEHELSSSPEEAIDLKHFDFLGEFGKHVSDLQKFCYDKSIRINMATMTPTIEQLISIYKTYKLYKNNDKNEVMCVFNNDLHKTYFLSKLI